MISIRVLASCLALVAAGGAEAMPTTLYFEGAITAFYSDGQLDASKTGSVFSGSVTFDPSNGNYRYEPPLAWPNNVWYAGKEQLAGCSHGISHAGTCLGMAAQGSAPGIVGGFSVDAAGAVLNRLEGALSEVQQWSSLQRTGGNGSTYKLYDETYLQSFSADRSGQHRRELLGSSFSLSLAGETGWSGAPGELDVLPDMDATLLGLSRFVASTTYLQEDCPGINVACTMLVSNRTQMEGRFTWLSFEPRAREVPEPSTIGLIVAALLGLTSTRIRREPPFLRR